MQGGSSPSGAFPSDSGSAVHLPDGRLMGHSEHVTHAESNLPDDPMHPASWSSGFLDEACTTARPEGTQFSPGSLVPLIFIAQSLWRSRKRWVCILPCIMMPYIHTQAGNAAQQLLIMLFQEPGNALLLYYTFVFSAWCVGKGDIVTCFSGACNKALVILTNVYSHGNSSAKDFLSVLFGRGEKRWLTVNFVNAVNYCKFPLHAAVCACVGWYVLNSSC